MEREAAGFSVTRISQLVDIFPVSAVSVAFPDFKALSCPNASTKATSGWELLTVTLAFSRMWLRVSTTLYEIGIVVFE